jgi:hypothetical protein
MNSLFSIREGIQTFYARYSRIIDRILKFVFAFFTFFELNRFMGFMKAASSPAVSAALAVICAFMPLIMTVVCAAALVLAHTYTVSLGLVIVTALIFVIMFIFYFRLSPKVAWVLIVMPICFKYNIPFVVPAICGLVSNPASLVAVGAGTIVFYMLTYIRTVAPTISGVKATDILTHATAYLNQLFMNKEMWVLILASAICVFVIYTIRRLPIRHAWLIGVISGVSVNGVVLAVMDVSLDVELSIGGLLLGSFLAVIIGIVLEFFFFSVDYSRTENLQFEDDDYYYYVKAVPKLKVASKERTVKRMNEIVDEEDEAGGEIEPPARIRVRKDDGSIRRPAKVEKTGVLPINRIKQAREQQAQRAAAKAEDTKSKTNGTGKTAKTGTAAKANTKSEREVNQELLDQTLRQEFAADTLAEQLNNM